MGHIKIKRENEYYTWLLKRLWGFINCGWELAEFSSSRDWKRLGCIISFGRPGRGAGAEACWFAEAEASTAESSGFEESTCCIEDDCPAWSMFCRAEAMPGFEPGLFCIDPNPLLIFSEVAVEVGVRRMGLTLRSLRGDECELPCRARSATAILMACSSANLAAL